MKAHRLVVYLTEMVRYELRIEIAREVLAENMNFCPAWILAVLHLNQNEPENQNLRICHFLRLFQLINFKCTNQEATAIFQYFDRSKNNQVSNQHFVEALLPTQREGLRKAVAKRTAEDIQWAKDLKYAFKRFFMQVQVCSKSLRDYETDFVDLSMSFAGNNELDLSKDEVASFLKKFNKFPTQTELHCIIIQIEGKRLKEVEENVLKNIIRQSLKKKSQGQEGHSSYRGNREPTQKSNYADRSISAFPETKVAKTVSIYKPLQSAENNIKISIKGQPSKEDAVKEKEEQTPINRIPKSSLIQETYKVHYPSQRKQLNTELSGLQSQNQEMRSQINRHKAENASMMNNIRRDLRTLGNH